MTTRAEIAEAHRLGPIHRFAMLKLVKVDAALAGPGDLELARKFLAVPDGIALDKALQRKDVGDLWDRGVLYIGEKSASLGAA